MRVGYKLFREGDLEPVKVWGGVWGQCPDIPNPIVLGDEVSVCGLTDIGPIGGTGYRLDSWDMDEPAPPVPESITRRQCALQLRALGLITGSEAVAMTRDGTPPATIQAYFNMLGEEARTLAEIDFAATSYFRANSLIGALLAAKGMTEADADAFFIAAAGF